MRFVYLRFFSRFRFELDHRKAERLGAADNQNSACSRDLQQLSFYHPDYPEAHKNPEILSKQLTTHNCLTHRYMPLYHRSNDDARKEKSNFYDHREIPNLFHMVFLIDKRISQTISREMEKSHVSILLDHNECFKSDLFRDMLNLLLLMSLYKDLTEGKEKMGRKKESHELHNNKKLIYCQEKSPKISSQSKT
ncbi:CLUMA_CG008844, isoform A [Clunio marinus]|uniref:CLUMA_CG008844, isoform A n=1 Tax=Clunio marinus TaxID=568069 RepID=A0A1J1I4V6_9DIPT|nr:CLUMA_CG008844, isoform A [Clunio marinus]